MAVGARVVTDLGNLKPLQTFADCLLPIAFSRGGNRINPQSDKRRSPESGP